MQLADRNRELDLKMSPSIYAALIDSLFQNPAPMFAGAVFAAVAAVMTALKTGDNLLWPCAALLIVTGAVRAFDMHRYKSRNCALNAEDAAGWEIRYQIGAMFYAAALGIWCLVALITSNDPVAHMICLTVTTGYMAAGVGRTYGRPWIFHLQIVLACGPMTIGLGLHGDPYYIGMACLSALFFLALKQITTGLQRMFVRALVAHEREAALANQFDTALNNMPHGLCMFGPDGRLAVVNHRFTEMMRLPDDLVRRDATAPDIVAACVAGATLSSASGQLVVSEIEKSQAGYITTVDPDAANDRALSWTFQPMAGGGTVVLLEDITERRNAEARISHLARYDDLTALPNRLNFRDEIERLLAMPRGAMQTVGVALRRSRPVQAGQRYAGPSLRRSAALCRGRPPARHAASGRFRRPLRRRRIRGVPAGHQSNEDAAVLARRIVDRLSERYKIDNHLVEIGASVGIAMTSPHGTSADTLLKNADMALYRAKADGRGTFCFFRDEMAQTVESRRILELDLRKALANEEFELFYQPLVNLKSGRISTCEALLRWNHPVRGTVSPIDIIPVAEDMGLIVDLGRWILRKACMECMRWPEAVSVAVNFSPQQFHQRDVLSEVRYALEVSGLPAHRLEIEITESSLLRNTQLTHDVLSQLRTIGVRISLDDFGTGYSSLSYLHNFPLQKVKIDRSFLEGIDTDRPLTLLRGVARLSADLGMSVVVEGIETNEQLELISADGTVTRRRATCSAVRCRRCGRGNC